MDNSYWKSLEAEIDIVNNLRAIHSGYAMLTGKQCRAELDFTGKVPTFKASQALNLDLDECVFEFQTEAFNLKVSGLVTSEQNTVNVTEGWNSRHSAGKIDRVISAAWPDNHTGLYRTYYHLKSNRFLYDFFGFKEVITFIANKDEYRLTSHDDFLIIEGLNAIAYTVYAEQVYNIMVAIGFVTGKFIQDHNYTFVVDQVCQFIYRRLRQGSDSIYHALTWNAYGYKNMLGREKAEVVAKSEILKPLDPISFGRLAEIINNHHAIQYALVLFNEANSNKLSLLIKNSSYYTVLEVLLRGLKPLVTVDNIKKSEICTIKAVFDEWHKNDLFH